MKEIPSVEKKTPLVELLFKGKFFLAVKKGRLARKWHGKSDLKIDLKIIVPAPSCGPELTFIILLVSMRSGDRRRRFRRPED